MINSKCAVLVLFAVITGCAFESVSEESESFVPEDQSESVGYTTDNMGSNKGCPPFASIKIVEIDGKEVAIYEPIRCSSAPELFPEVNPELINHNVIDDKIRTPSISESKANSLQ